MRSALWQNLRSSLLTSLLTPLAVVAALALGGTALILTQAGAEVARVRWLLLGLVAVAMLSAIAVTLIALQRAVIRPLAAMESVLERRIAGDRGARVTPAGDHQIASLSRAIGGVLAMHDADLANSTVIRSALPDITLRLRRDGAILDSQINESQSLIADPSRLEGSPLASHLPAAVARWFESLAGDLSGQDDPAEFEFTSSGRFYEARVRASGGGEIMMVIRDDTHRKQQEAQLVSAERYFRWLLERFPGSVIDLDPDGHVRYASRLPFDTGEGQRGIGNVRFEDIFPESTWPAFERAFESARTTGQETEFEVIEDHDDGEQCWVSRIAPVAGDEPGQQRIVVVITDESARHQLRLRLRRRIETLESQYWDYEKRTTDLLTELEEVRSERDAMAGYLREPASVAQDRGSDMREPLADLGVGQQAAGEEVHFHLSTLIDDVTRACAAESGAGTPRTSVAIQPSLPQSLRGDAAALRDALRALLRQSLAGPAGGVEVVISQEASRPGTASMQFEVRVTNLALDERALQAARAFLGVPDTPAMTPAGIPDHLVRARRAADRLGVRIALDSAPDSGGAYRFSATFAIDDDAGNGHRWMRGLRTLVIQERGNQTNGVQRALSGFGIIGYVVQNEDELLSALEAAEDAKNPYRLILVDAATPGLEGFARCLAGQNAPVVLIGSSGAQGRAGYDGFLTNPVHQSELLEIILSVVEPPAATGPDDIEIDASALV